MLPKDKLALPIDPYIDQITSDLQKYQTLIIKSSPGSGKTTRLPWPLAQSMSGKLFVLEPRRLAAKLASERIAFENMLTLGQEIGYHYRFDKKYSPITKLVFFTEGTFLKHLLHHPNLDEVSGVILDEFHERHIETDLALAALLEIQSHRSDFKIILMSATIDVEAKLNLPDSKVIEINAPRFEVKIHYLSNTPSILEERLERKIKNALIKERSTSGHVLIFVPGMYEMRKIQDYLGDEFGHIFILHSDLSKEEQDQALGASLTRKIILATSIAESSITIPGVTVVIDSGLTREAFYSPWSGIKTIETVKSTQATLIQRAGRAGRTAPGVCYRLMSEQDYHQREAFRVPEILKADLFDTFLLTRKLNKNLSWPTPPPKERLEKAQNLAFMLGLIDSANKLNHIGEEVLKTQAEARIASTLIAAKALSSDKKRDLIAFICQNLERDSSPQMRRRFDFFTKIEGHEEAPFEKFLLNGFIDQIAKFRPKQNDLIHYSGKSLKIHSSLKNLHHDFYLVFEVTQKQEAIFMVPVLEEWAYELNPFPFTEEDSLQFNERITLNRQTKLGSIVIDQNPIELDWKIISDELKNKFIMQAERVFLKKWETWKATPLYGRYLYLAKRKNLLLEPMINTREYFEKYQEFDWENVEFYFEETIKQALLIIDLDQELPSEITLQNQKKMSIHYLEGQNPFIEAPIQDFYGLKDPPTILRGEITLTVKLVGPHKRPLQVTQDLSGFWSKAYREMKKELMRDYPRHYWPDEPLTARPIRLKSQLN